MSIAVDVFVNEHSTTLAINLGGITSSTTAAPLIHMLLQHYITCGIILSNEVNMITKKVSVYIPEKTYEDLVLLAKREHRSISSQIVHMLTRNLSMYYNPYFDSSFSFTGTTRHRVEGEAWME